MKFEIRICRHPLAAEAAGGAVVSADPAKKAAAPEADKAAGRTADEQDAKTRSDAGETPEETAAKPAAKAEVSDWAAYQKMQEKFEKNPNARPTKREIALQEKYHGKDEKLIEGWTPQDKPAGAADEDDAPAASAKDQSKEEPKEKPESTAIPKELESLIGDKSPIKAKTLAELPAKVLAMAEKIERMNGDFGAVGRIMQAAGVESLKGLGEEIKGAKRLSALVKDLKAGHAEAFAFLGIKPPTAPGRQAQAQDGEPPRGILDTELYGHISPQLKAANDKIALLERQLNDRFKDVDEWKSDNQKRSAETQRTQHVNEIITEVGTLVQGADGLWDAKKSGPLNKALLEYYSTPDGEAYNPALKPILEILTIAKKHRLDDLDVAYAYWDRQNAATRMRQARDEARQPFTGKAQSVGLSDQQQNHSGQFKEYTKIQVQNMGKKGYPPIPSEWTDETGTFLENKVPAYARSWLFGEIEE
jgi:hypothetical protein